MGDFGQAMAVRLTACDDLASGHQVVLAISSRINVTAVCHRRFSRSTNFTELAN